MNLSLVRRISHKNIFLFYSFIHTMFFFFQAAEQEYEKEKLNERIAKLSGGVAVIQVYSSLCQT
jgi:hypothetical protein